MHEFFQIWTPNHQFIETTTYACRASRLHPTTRARAMLAAMGYPRYLLVPPETPGTYHCVSRCVRRAFLCGHDPVSGRSFGHRKQWLEDRILALARIFAVAVHAYAVMDNHFHVVLETDPGAPVSWSDEEVARRWLALTARPKNSDAPLEYRVTVLLSQPQRLAVLRERLGSLSWFMRYLKEPIARRANAEDGCTGRFWEGRFRTQDLLDDPAVLACMVYVDLNPVRAGLADSPEHGRHTSVRRRLDPFGPPDARLSPLAASIRSQVLPLSTAQYLTLLTWTADGCREDGRAQSPTPVPPILERLDIRPRQWLIQVRATESRYWRAIGRTEALVEGARALGLRWLRGIGTARRLDRIPHPT